MHKSINMNALRERNGLRIVLAISFTIFLAGLGACSTNYTPGNGQPTGSVQYGSKPHAATYGSSSGSQGSVPQSRMIVAPETITPMYSSSSEAIAVLAGHQGRFLGYANPGPASANYGLDIPTGQVVPPSWTANPESTVNSSISSAPTPVITSGIGDAGGAVVIGGLSSAATTSALTSAATASSSTAPVFVNSGSVTTPTNTALAASAGLFAAGPGISSTSTSASTNQNTGLLTPTMSSASTPTPTRAANPALASAGTSSSATTAPTTVSPTITRSRAVSQPIAITAPITIPGRVARPVRMTTSSSGTVTISNQ